MHRSSALIAAFVAALVVGCASPTPVPVGSPTSAGPAAATVSASPGTTPPPGNRSTALVEPTYPAEAAQPVDRAKQALASRAGVPASQIQVVSVSSATWPDSALGCPQPGLLYSQIVTPGYKIVLSAAGKTYEYHSDRGQHVTYCTSP